MKELLFVLSICGLVCTSCGNSAKQAPSKTETHQHNECNHDHGDNTHSHDSAHHQEEFEVDSTEQAHEGTHSHDDHNHTDDHQE